MREGLSAVQINKTSDLTRSADFNWCLTALLKEAVGVVGGLRLKRWLQSPNKELFWNRWLPGCAGSCGPSWLFTHPSWRAAAGQSAAQQDGRVGPRPWKRRRQRRGVRDCSAECQGDALTSFRWPPRQEQPASLLLIKQEVFKSHSRAPLIGNLENLDNSSELTTGQRPTKSSRTSGICFSSTVTDATVGAWISLLSGNKECNNTNELPSIFVFQKE